MFFTSDTKQYGWLWDICQLAIITADKYMDYRHSPRFALKPTGNSSIATIIAPPYLDTSFKFPLVRKVTVGRAKDANRPLSVASHKCYSKDESAQTSPNTPPSHWWGRRSSPPPPQSAFPPTSPGALSPGTIVQIGNAFVNDIVKRRPKTFRGNAPWPVEFFALSPSGRAFTLSVPQDGSVLDAKEQVEIHEGVPPYHQRLLWRGIPLEPDHASLHELGVRGRDTLILGYRIPRFPPDSSTPVIQLGNSQRFVPESQAGPGCKFSTRDGTSSSIYFTGNTTPGEDERRVGMSHRGGYPRDFRAMDNRVDSESGGIWGSSSRQSNGSWPANAKFQSYKRNGETMKRHTQAKC